MMIGSKRNGPKKRGIPKWVASHSLFPNILDDMNIKYKISQDDDPFMQLSLYKEVLIKAGQQVIEQSRGDAIKTPSQTLVWISKARFSVKAGNSFSLKRSLDAIPDFLKFFDLTLTAISDPVGLFSVIAELHVLDIEAQISEIDLSSLKVEEKAPKKSRLHSKLSSWSPKGKRMVGITVLDTGGHPYTSTEEADNALKAHWEPIFN
eukprot:2746059-Heterocapsa_arctica.AAC.1